MVCASVLVGVTAVVGAAPASAAPRGVVDQQNLGPAANGTAEPFGWSQTFRAGVTGYLSEVDLVVLLTYAHGTQLDNSIAELQPLAASRGVGLINAAALTLGLLSPQGSNVSFEHPASAAVQQAAARMVAFCKQRGVDPAFIANQYAIQRSGCATTVVGVGKSKHLASAIAAVTTPIDEGLLAELLALRPAEGERQWLSGLPANN